MSTRADFYLGRGLESTWIGSIGHDAFVDELAPYFEGVTTEAAYREALQRVFTRYGEIAASRGWPWPWKDSTVTGTAFSFDEGTVWVCCHGKTWTPLGTPDDAGGDTAVFPDMVTSEEATAEGRLRRRLRLSGALQLAADQPVLPSLLTRSAYLLDRDWLHSHRQGDTWCTMNPGYTIQDGIFDFIRGVSDHKQTLAEMVRLQKEADGLEVWDLITWCADNLRYKRGDEQVHLEVTETTPVYFGQPLTQELRDELSSGELPYVVVPFTEEHVQGMRLLNLALDAIPYVHGFAVAHELVGTRFAWTSAAAEAALNVPRDELDGHALSDFGNTPENRERMNKLAAVWRFE